VVFFKKFFRIDCDSSSKLTISRFSCKKEYKRLEKLSVVWSDPEYRRRKSESAKTSYTLDLRKRKSEIMKEKAKDSEYIERVRQGVLQSYQGEQVPF
jgi:hypothetical protein